MSSSILWWKGLVWTCSSGNYESVLRNKFKMFLAIPFIFLFPCLSLFQDSFTGSELKSLMYTFRHLPEYCLFLSMALAVWHFNNVKNPILRSKEQKHSLGSRYLHTDKLEVQPFFLHQFPVASLLHNDSILKPSDDICISDCRQSVCNHNGGPAFSGLKEKRRNTWGSGFTRLIPVN